MNAATVAGKPFTWSYSHLRNFETCARRYNAYQVEKSVAEPESQQLREGNELHKAFEDRIVRNVALPPSLARFESLLRVTMKDGVVHGEMKMALTSDFKPSAYFGKRVWFRTVIDATIIKGDVATVLDWKTGKPSVDLTQLQLMAATLLHTMPKLRKVNAALVFVNHDTVEPASFTRDDLSEIWAEILPRVRRLEQMRATGQYPPTQSGLCGRYCAVTSCEHYGGRR